VIQHIKEKIHPGLRDLDLFAEAHYAATKQGMESGQVLISSYTPGNPSGFQQRHFMNRVLKKGDIFTMLVERPAIRYDEPMKIQVGMNIAVHPFCKTKKVWATVCDNCLVTETGVSPCLHKTPKDITVT
jgi:Xaa-Pro aminopeptidase